MTNQKKVFEYINSFKPVDGHFWVERDGKVIDPYFKDYDNIKKIRNLVGNSIYMIAPIEDMMISIWKKDMTKKMGICNFEECCKVFLKEYGFQKTYGNCWINCLIEVYNNGGKIRFGSMGWKKNNSDDIFWEFGGTNYKTVNDFFNKPPAIDNDVVEYLNKIFILKRAGPVE